MSHGVVHVINIKCYIASDFLVELCKKSLKFCVMKLCFRLLTHVFYTSYVTCDIYYLIYVF